MAMDLSMLDVGVLGDVWGMMSQCWQQHAPTRACCAVLMLTIQLPSTIVLFCHTIIMFNAWQVRSAALMARFITNLSVSHS